MKTKHIYLSERDAAEFGSHIRALQIYEAERTGESIPSESAIIRQAVDRWYKELPKERR